MLLYWGQIGGGAAVPVALGHLRNKSLLRRVCGAEGERDEREKQFEEQPTAGQNSRFEPPDAEGETLGAVVHERLYEQVSDSRNRRETDSPLASATFEQQGILQVRQ